MSTLEVLLNFHAQKNAFLLIIGCFDPLNSNLVFFNHEKYTSRLSSQLAFMIQVVVHGKTILHFIANKGSSNYIMSMYFWKAIGSPQLS